MRLFAVALGVLLTLAASAAAADAPLKGFSHDNKEEIFGFYMSANAIKVGKFNLDSLSIGSLEEMAKYESGKKRLPTYAPVMFIFQDTGSKKATERYARDVAKERRVLPSYYRIKGDTIAFAGTHNDIGAVSFTGTLDADVLKAVREGSKGTDAVIIKGDLTLAGKVFKGVSFLWSAGD